MRTSLYKIQFFIPIICLLFAELSDPSTEPPSLQDIYLNTSKAVVRLKFDTITGSGFFITKKRLVTKFHVLDNMSKQFVKQQADLKHTNSDTNNKQRSQEELSTSFFNNIIISNDHPSKFHLIKSPKDKGIKIKRILGLSAFHDLIILEVEGYTGPVLPILDQEEKAEQQKNQAIENNLSYAAIGFAGGKEKIILRIHLLDSLDFNQYIFIKNNFHDERKVHGMSGGPIINESGKVVGILSLRFPVNNHSLIAEGIKSLSQLVSTSTYSNRQNAFALIENETHSLKEMADKKINKASISLKAESERSQKSHAQFRLALVSAPDKEKWEFKSFKSEHFLSKLFFSEILIYAANYIIETLFVSSLQDQGRQIVKLKSLVQWAIKYIDNYKMIWDFIPNQTDKKNIFTSKMLKKKLKIFYKSNNADLIKTPKLLNEIKEILTFIAVEFYSQSFILTKQVVQNTSFSFAHFMLSEIYLSDWFELVNTPDKHKTMKLKQNGISEEAFKHYSLASQKGHPQAQYMMWFMLKKGMIKNPSPNMFTMSLHNLMKSANSGNPFAITETESAPVSTSLFSHESLVASFGLHLKGHFYNLSRAIDVHRNNGKKPKAQTSSLETRPGIRTISSSLYPKLTKRAKTDPPPLCSLIF